MMDDETRFWIAQEVAETKFRHDARNLLQMSKQLMGKKPMIFITDGLPSYNDAYKKEFWTNKEPRTKHIRHITLEATTTTKNGKNERRNPRQRKNHEGIKKR